MWSKPDEWTYEAIKGRALKYEDQVGYLRFAVEELEKRVRDYETRRRSLGTSREDQLLASKLDVMIRRDRELLRRIESEL